MHALPLPPLRPRWFSAALAVLACAALSGCDIPGMGPDPRAVQRETEAKAIGGACRHAMRGLEDCFTLNPKAPKAAVFTGWKDMDAYMRENKIEGTPSVLGKMDKPAANSSSRRADDAEADEPSGRNRS